MYPNKDLIQMIQFSLTDVLALNSTPFLWQKEKENTIKLNGILSQLNEICQIALSNDDILLLKKINENLKQVSEKHLIQTAVIKMKIISTLIECLQ